MAKLSGIRRAVAGVMNENVSRNRSGEVLTRATFAPSLVQHYFQQAAAHLQTLRQQLPSLYGDFQPMDIEPATAMSLPGPEETDRHFSRAQVERLIRDIDQVFEIRANTELEQPKPQTEPRVFISHGRSNDWREDRCDSAVIVMTADDVANADEPRVRENVMHELGFFQGRYGRNRVILLHEEGVNIPTNLAGVAYIAFPNHGIAAGFHVLQRELRATYKMTSSAFLPAAANRGPEIGDFNARTGPGAS